MSKTLAVRTALFLSLIFLSPKEVTATNYLVNVYYNRYSPSTITIAPGDSVFWVNQDYMEHSVTSMNGLWQTGYLWSFQDSFGLTFNAAGTYSYYCEFDGFAGTVVVSSGGSTPPNDQCASAIAMTEGTIYTVNTGSATSTADPVPSCANLGKGVWYTFTPVANGTVTVSTCGSDFDTVLAVYTGSCGTLSALACGDDNGPSCSGTTASVVFSGTAGTTYHILAGGYSSAWGNLRIVATTSASGTWQEAPVSYDIGPSIARPDTNLIHVVDNTNDRLLTFDTSSGAFVSSIRLYGKMSTSSGLMCFSTDGQYLYVPLYSTNRLQVISLATLTTTDLVPLSVSPTSLAAGSDGALYAMVDGQITKIDPVSGQILASVPWNFYAPIIKANPSGTRLYIMELGLSGGSSMIDEYAVVPSAPPVYVTSHFNGKANDKDFVIAEDIGWLYSTSGGVYGIGAWDMNTRTYSFWPYGSAYGVAVAMVPNDPLVYGASGDYYSPRIRSFNRLTGAVSNTFDIATSGRGYGSVNDRSLKVTPNGRILYVRGRKLGLIGGSNLDTNTPPTAEVIDAGTNLNVHPGASFALSALAPNASTADTFSWAKLSGPGAVTFSAADSLVTTAQVDTPGDYTLQIVRSNPDFVSQDLLHVTAVSGQIRFDTVGLDANGRIQLRLLSDPGSFQVQVSTNLVNWEPLTNIISAAGDSTILDPVTNAVRRFYRAESQP